MSADLVHADVLRLSDIVDRGALSEVCRSFFDLFSLPVRIFARDGSLLADVHETREICRYVNTIDTGERACAAIVSEVKGIDPEGGSIVHTCFTGAVYRIVPIDYHGRRVGRFVLGPYMPAETRDVPPSLLSLDARIDAAEARDALAEMPRVRAATADRIAAHLSRVLELIVFSGHRAHLTSEMHIASVRESYRELTEKNDALQEAYDDLKELDRLKSNFLATVSHELRTPLTSIIGYSDMLASGIAGELSGEQADFVDTIRSKGDHLLALISSLLDLNKMEQGRVTLELEPTDPRALVREVAKTLKPQANKKSVRLVLQVEEPLDSVPLDRVRARQVLFNLTENAIKFSPAGDEVTIGARMTEREVGSADDDMGFVLFGAPRRAIELWVSDHGPGIPQEERERIFDAFYQIDGGSTREHGGTGLGLSIVARLVQAHGGEVLVESEPGEGTTFRVIIPEPDEG